MGLSEVQWSLVVVIGAYLESLGLVGSSRSQWGSMGLSGGHGSSAGVIELSGGH